MHIRTVLKWTAGALGLATGAYATTVAISWLRYGQPAAARAENDPLLDRFMPAYDVAERHHIQVAAPGRSCITLIRWLSLGPVRREAERRARLLGR